MKPRTKMHHRVLGLSKNYLFDVNDKILSWAKVDCLEHRGYATKSRVICMDCGNTFSPELVSRKRAVCPHCDTKIKVDQSRKRTDEQRTYIATAEICDEFQVIRNFELRSYHKSGEATRYYISEILQHWVLSNGKREVVARRHTVSWYYNSWGGLMEIQNKSNDKKYDVYAQRYHPDSAFKAEYRKYGIDKDFQGLSFLEAIQILPESPRAETLLKAKEYDLFGCCSEYNLKHRIYDSWASIKICLRNKYKIKDVKIWFDYLDLLKHFGKDLRNAHYVCPKNLNKEHDKLVKKKRKAQDKLNAERKRKKMLEDTKIFNELKSKFFGIAFSKGEIEVRVLETVEEVMEEGDILHHCVFTNGYFKQPDSLILSATVNGKKTETVEVSLKKLKVVQCRGLQNGNSEYHDRIIALVNKNMHLIKERLKPKKDGTKKNVTAAA